MERKINNAIRRIRVASHIAERHGEVMVVCFSGGKDSQVMLHLVERSGVPFRAVYTVTTIDHPMNVNFIRKNYPQVKFIHPKFNFWDLCKKKKMLPTMAKRFCCEHLKEYYGNGIIAVGVRREESRKRANYRIFERKYRGKQRGSWLFRPIIDWLEWEVWQYIEDNGLPVNPCYDFVNRVGCMVCPYQPAKLTKERFDEFPNLKKKMLKLIHELRDGGKFCLDYPYASDEDVLRWWISKKPIAEVLSPEFNFDEKN